MRIFLLLCASISFLSVKAQNSTVFFEKADSFFGEYCKNGKVDYQRAKEDADLILLMGLIKNEPIPEGKEKAYLINAYNLFVIHEVIKNYPLSSPLDKGDFFTAKSFDLAGEKISLDVLENHILRKKYADPRLHFALVCGAIGCPPIVDFAYTPEALDSQLDQQTRKALNNDAFVYEEEKGIYLSEIFKWYAEDFGKNNDEVIAYVNGFRTQPFDEKKGVKYYPYNWKLNEQSKAMESVTPVKIGDAEPSTGTNLQTFTAGSLLGQGKMDITLFNTLYTENKGDWAGQTNTGYRSTFVTHLLQYTIGVTKNKRFNIGLDLNFRSTGNSTDSTYGGIANAFAYKNNDSSRVGLTSAGLRLKFQPFKAVKDFTIQSTFLIPTIKHPEGLSDSDPATQNLFWADWNRLTWWNQLFYTKTFAKDKLQLFAEVDFLYRFRVNKSQIGMLDMPVSAFLSYFPTKKITVYLMTQHVQRFANNVNQHDPVVTDWVRGANYTASGVGFKYQILSNLNLELLYTNFWRGQNSGLGETFNLGIKFLTK